MTMTSAVIVQITTVSMKGSCSATSPSVIGSLVRTAECAIAVASHVRITTDDNGPYLDAVEGAFGVDVDYAMLVKIYGQEPEAEKRYSPAKCIGTNRRRIEGKPDPKHISTPYAERQDLTMRMSLRRFTRLTNVFSKKVEDHVHALSIYFMY